MSLTSQIGSHKRAASVPFSLLLGTGYFAYWFETSKRSSL